MKSSRLSHNEMLATSTPSPTSPTHVKSMPRPSTPPTRIAVLLSVISHFLTRPAAMDAHGLLGALHKAHTSGKAERAAYERGTTLNGS